MAINVNDIIMKVKVDTSDGVNRLGLLEEAYQKLAKVYNSTKDQALKQTTWDAMQGYSEEMEKRRKELGLEGLTIQQLKRLQAEYAQQWTKTFVEGSEQWTLARKNYDKVSERIKEVTKNIKGLNAQQEALMKGLLQTVEQFGAEAITVTELEQLSSHLFKTIKEGSKAGQENLHPMYQTWLNLQTVMKQSKDNMNALKVAENAYKQELRDTVSELGIEALSLNKLKDYYKLLQEEIAEATTLENEHGQALIRNSQAVQQRINTTQARVQGRESFMQSVFGQIPAAFAGGIGGGVAAFALENLANIPGKIKAAINAFGELDRTSTDIEIALGKTDAQIQQLNKDLKEIDTETPVKDLKELAIVAGDLNETDVENFVEGMNKAYKVFERDFSNAEELANTFGKLKDLFPESRKMTMIEFIDSYGSAIKVMNDNGPATTKGIIEFMTIMGQLPDKIKPAGNAVIGFAALFEEAGLTPNVSAGGLSNILLIASQNSELFAKQLRMSTGAVRELISTDPNAFLQKLAMSFRFASGAELGEKLAKLKINSQESVKVIGVLTDKIWDLKDKQDVASKSMDEAARINEVYAKKNEDAAAVTAKAGKVMESAMTRLSKFFSAIIFPLVKGIASLGEKTKSLSDDFNDNAKKTTDLQSKLEKLSTITDEMQTGTTNSAIAYRELQKVMSDIVQIVPQAATKYDEFGRIVKFNIGVVNDFIEKQKQANQQLKLQIEDESIKKLDEMVKRASDVKERLKVLTNPNYPSSQIIYKQEIQKLSNELVELRYKIHAERKAIRDLNTEVEVKPVEPPKKEDSNFHHYGGSDKDYEKYKKERIKRLKDEQDDLQKSIEIQAKMIFEADKARASEEDKQVIEAERKAEENLQRVHTQFTDENGLILKHYQLTIAQKQQLRREEKNIETTLKNEVLGIRKKFAEERANQLKEQITKTHELANQLKVTELQAQINTAQRTGDTQQAYLLQRQLLQQHNIMSLEAIETRYLAEREKLKNNKAALTELEKNYAQEQINLKKQTVAQLDQLDAQHTEQTKRRITNSELERQRLQVSADETEGEDPLQSKLALLNSEMLAELQVVGQTEQEKANIREKYRQLELELQKQHVLEVGQKIVQKYTEVFSSLASFFQTNLNNRKQAENDQYQQDIDNLNSQREQKIISEKEYNKQKKILDDKHKQEEKQFRKEQFEITRAENLSKATMELALSLIRVSDKPYMIPFVAAIGAAQIANILSAQPPAYEQGGYTEKGMRDGGPGFLIRVAEKGTEYIIPNWQLQDPVVAQITEYLNYRRVNKITGDDNTGGIATARTSTPNSAPAQGGNISNEMLVGILTKMNTTLEQLPQRLSEAPLSLNFDNEDAYQVSKKINENNQTQKDALR